MKKFINVLLGLFIVCTSVVLVGVLMTQSQVRNIGTLFPPTFVEVETQIEHYLDPIREVVPVEKQAQFDALQEKVVQDPQFQDITESLATSALNDIVTGGSSIDEAALKADVQTYIESYGSEIETLSDGQVTSETVSAVVEETLNNTDIQSTYETIITRVQEELSPRQTKILGAVDWFTQNSQKIIIGMSVLLGIALILVLVLNPGWHWTRVYGHIAVFCSLIMLLGFLASPFIMTAIQNKVGVDIPIKNNPFKWFLWTGVGVLVSSVIFKLMSRLES